MINDFSTIQANEQSIVPVIVDGKEWQQMTTTRWDNMEGNAGGDPRAQFKRTDYLTPNFGHAINFDLMIPGDWVQDGMYVDVFDIHAERQTQNNAVPFAMYIVGDEFICHFKEDDDPNKPPAEFRMNWIHDHAYEFRIYTHINDDMLGPNIPYSDCKVNGQQFWYYERPTMFPNEDPRGPYWKVGPYVAAQGWNTETDFRRLLVRV